jgi:Outer membrane protein beta-barrel domain
MYVVRAINVDGVTGRFTAEKNTRSEALELANRLRKEGFLVIITGPDGKTVDDEPIAHDRWLIYGKAGVAWNHTNYTDNWVGGGVPHFSGTGSENRVGWTVGMGIEWAIWNNWSIKAEYDYLDFGNRTVAINGTVLPGIVNFPASFGMENAQHINQFKAGLNWRILPNFW